MKGRGWIVGLSMLACAPEPLRLPETVAQSVAVIAEATPRVAVIASYGTDADALPFPSRDDTAALQALFFADSLETLGLVAGEHVEASLDPWSQRLPRAKEAYSGSWSSPAWRAIDAAVIEPFLLGVESPIACVERGGCFVSEQATTCTVPCPQQPEPEPPAPPEPPRHRPCPAGWIDDPGAYACRPYSGDPAACTAGEIQRPGEPACHALGSACSGAWPVIADEAATTFVSPGATGGDGTRAAPYGTIAAAIAAAPPAHTIALGRGTHAAPASLVGARSIIGTCATETRVQGTELALGGDLSLDSLGLDARLTIGGTVRLRAVSARGGVALAADATLSARDTAIEGPIDARSSAQLALSDARVTGALSAIDTASVSIVRSRIEGTLTSTASNIAIRESALEGGAGPTLAVEAGRLTLDVTQLGGSGRPLVVTGPSTAVARRMLVGRNGNGMIFGPTTTVTIEDTRVDGTRNVVPVFRAVDSVFTVRRISLGDGYDHGLLNDGTRGRTVIEDILFPPSFGVPIDATSANLRISRVEMSIALEIDVLAPPDAPGYAVEMEDVRIHNGAFRLRDDGRVRIARLAVTNCRGACLWVQAQPMAPTVVATDVRFEGSTRRRDCDNSAVCSGAGIYSETSAFDLERFRIAGNSSAGVIVTAQNATMRFHGGTLANQPVGLIVNAPASLLRGLLESTVLENVPTLCAPCGSER